jgi:hypothetical protein
MEQWRDHSAVSMLGTFVHFLGFLVGTVVSASTAYGVHVGLDLGYMNTSALRLVFDL